MFKFFTQDMIKPIPYDPANFKPIKIDEVEVPDDLIQLGSLSPSFSPTPPTTLPPDGFRLHQELLSFKKSLAWKVHFRRATLKAASSFQEFLAAELSVFNKVHSTRTPPALPPLLEAAFQYFYSKLMDPCSWPRYQQNLSPSNISALKTSTTIQENNVGIYL